MKKSSFIAMVLGTVSLMLFALGMCMALIPEWDAFKPGIVFGWTGSSVNDTNYMEKNGTQASYPHINETGGYSYYWRNRRIDSRRWNVFQHGLGNYGTRNHNRFYRHYYLNTTSSSNERN